MKRILSIVSTVLLFAACQAPKTEETVVPPTQEQTASEDFTGSAAEGVALTALMDSPSGIAIDPEGRVVVGEREGFRVRRIDLGSGTIETIAGVGEQGFGGDGGPATEAMLGKVEHVAYDSKGNLYVCDRTNFRVRRVDGETGIITTVVGIGRPGYSGDDGPASEASISHPFGIALDANDNLFIADTENHASRRVDAGTGVITTVAGGQKGFGGDGGPAVDAKFQRPHLLTFDPEGRLVLGDSFNQRIRRVDLSSGKIETIAGNGEMGWLEDGSLAKDSSFVFFGAFAYDSEGNLVFSSLDNRIAKIEKKTGKIKIIAGTGEESFGGDGGPALDAKLHLPNGLAIDGNDNIYFADGANNRVRRIDAVTGRIETIAGRDRQSKMPE